MQQDAEKAKNEASSKLQETYDKASQEAKDLERKGLDAAKRGEKKYVKSYLTKDVIDIFILRVEKAYGDASKQVSDFWKRFSSEPKYWATSLGVGE